MPKLINLIGRHFGRLTVIERADNNKRGKSRWLCKCNCKNEIIILGYHLKSGHTQSCGCLQKKMAGMANTIHGHWNDRTYKSWYAMIQRCTNPNNSGYKYYGDRGIVIYKEWLKFSNFFRDMGETTTQVFD